MVTYTVQPGDTLFLIARRYNITVQRLLELNPLPNPDMLSVGMVLEIDDSNSGGGDPFVTRFVDGLLYTIVTDRFSFHRGQPVPVMLVKTNIRAVPVTLHYVTGQRFDFEVLREGRVVWRWSAGRAFPQMTGRVTLQPGESQNFNIVWDQRDNNGNLVPPGDYTIRGFNVAEGLQFHFVPIGLRITAVITPPPTPTPFPTPAPGGCPGDNLLGGRK